LILQRSSPVKKHLKAETSTDKLSKGVKSLAKTLGVAFGAQQVLAFAKASVKAAAADEKAQKQLALALKNVGLGRDAATSEAFIQKLQSEFGIVDDKLRPAFQQLAVATQDTAQSQKLLQIALDISASTGRDLASVTGAISKAYLGNNTALGKLGVGISKADLKAKSFDDIMNQLSTTFAGSATASANTFQGSMDKLSVASANVQEIIGKGIIDSLKILAEDTTVDDLAKSMQDLATYTADVVRGIALVIAEFKKIPGGDKLIPNLKYLILPKPIMDALDIINKIGATSTQLAGNTGLAHLAELEARYANITLATKKKLTAEELKQLKAKQLKLAIDKANLALGKSDNVFDMEKISLAAAEKNAAEQLGKVTSQAQLLQITNDLARLKVKQSILDLEDAIKSKDVEAITNATNKLNADLKIIGALTGQEVKLKDIKSILDAILPKDLINLANLDAALAKLTAIGKAIVTPTATATATATPTGTATLAAPTVMMPSIFAQGGRIDMAGNYNPFNAAMMGMTSGGSSGNKGVTVVVNAGTVANPDELVTLIQNGLITLNKRGDLLTQAGSL